MASLSAYGVTHPPRSNPPLRSSSGPPSPCITPSTVTIVMVVSFMIAVPFSLVCSRSIQPDRGADLIGRSRVRPADSFRAARRLHDPVERQECVHRQPHRLPLLRGTERHISSVDQSGDEFF